MGNRQQVTHMEERPLQKTILQKPIFKYPTWAYFVKVKAHYFGNQTSLVWLWWAKISWTKTIRKIWKRLSLVSVKQKYKIYRSGEFLPYQRWRVSTSYFVFVFFCSLNTLLPSPMGFNNEPQALAFATSHCLTGKTLGWHFAWLSGAFYAVSCKGNIVHLEDLPFNSSFQQPIDQKGGCCFKGGTATPVWQNYNCPPEFKCEQASVLTSTLSVALCVCTSWEKTRPQQPHAAAHVNGNLHVHIHAQSMQPRVEGALI